VKSQTVRCTSGGVANASDLLASGKTETCFRLSIGANDKAAQALVRELQAGGLSTSTSIVEGQGSPILSFGSYRVEGEREIRKAVLLTMSKFKH
jgi:sugar/nucleoside kinase (ribokinase family)